jgi:amino acid permease
MHQIYGVLPSLFVVPVAALASWVGLTALAYATQKGKQDETPLYHAFCAPNFKKAP